MDNQDLTLERRLQAKDKLIAELLDALLGCLHALKFGSPGSDKWNAMAVADKAIRKAKEK